MQQVQGRALLLQGVPVAAAPASKSEARAPSAVCTRSRFLDDSEGASTSLSQKLALASADRSRFRLKPVLRQRSSVAIRCHLQKPSYQWTTHQHPKKLRMTVEQDLLPVKNPHRLIRLLIHSMSLIFILIAVTE